MSYTCSARWRRSMTAAIWHAVSKRRSGAERPKPNTAASCNNISTSLHRCMASCLSSLSWPASRYWATTSTACYSICLLGTIRRIWHQKRLPPAMNPTKQHSFRDDVRKEILQISTIITSRSCQYTVQNSPVCSVSLAIRFIPNLFWCPTCLQPLVCELVGERPSRNHESPKMR